MLQGKLQLIKHLNGRYLMTSKLEKKRQGGGVAMVLFVLNWPINDIACNVSNK